MFLGVAKGFWISNGKALKIECEDVTDAPTLLMEFIWSGTHSFGVLVQGNLYCLGYAPSFPSIVSLQNITYIGSTTSRAIYVYNCFRKECNMSVVDYDMSNADKPYLINSTITQ